MPNKTHTLVFSKKLLEQISFCSAILCLLWLQTPVADAGQKFPPITDADAVILLSESELSVINSSQAFYKKHVRILINTPAGKKNGEFTVYEGKFVKTKKIAGKILTPDEKEIQKLKKEDIIEGSNVDGYVLYADTKYSWVKLAQSTFPYIVDFTFEQELKSLFFWPDWLPRNDIPVLKSIYRLEIPSELQYRQYSIGLDLEPRSTIEKGKKVLTWQLDSLAAIVTESYMPATARTQNALLFVPLEFKIDKYSGSFASWTEFGNWYNQLCAGRTQLPPAASAEIRQLVAETDSEIQKVKKIYRFIQDYTRYVAIELGVGGWQPYSAADVYHYRYGDCKDLSNLLIAMLAETGIRAYPAIIGTRSSGQLIRDFPYPRMNHVLVYVPLANDTLWLESTSDLISAGDLPYEIEGCDALVVREAGGQIVRTPQSCYQENVWSSRIDATLAINGVLNFNGRISTTGEKSGYLRNNLRYLKPEEQKRWLIGRLSYYSPKLELKAHEFSNLEDNLEQSMQMKFAGVTSSFASRTSNRLFLNPNILHRETASSLSRETERQFPIEYNYAYQDLDTLILALPADYELESGPEPLNLDYSFAHLVAGYTFSQGALCYYRNVIWRQRQIPASAYSEYLTFVQTLVKLDKAQFVFRKI